MTEYEKAFKNLFPITMYINNENQIYKYISNDGNILWKPNDLIDYKGKFKKGDIVNYYKGEELMGRFVIIDAPHTIYEYLKSPDYKFFEYKSGYSLCGYNPYEKTSNGKRKLPIGSWDVNGVFDDDLELAINDIDTDFFEGLSVYGKYHKRTYIKKDVEKELYFIDPLFDLYFKNKDYNGFKKYIDSLKESIEI